MSKARRSDHLVCFIGSVSIIESFRKIKVLSKKKSKTLHVRFLGLVMRGIHIMGGRFFAESNYPPLPYTLYIIKKATGQ